MKKTLWWGALAALVCAGAAAGGGAAGESVVVRLSSEHVALTNRPGVTNVAIHALLHNERAVHQLSYGALIGGPLRFGDDQQTEGVRKPWAPYKPLPTAEQLGYAPIGLQPEGNWDDFGFFNLAVNDVDLAGCEPAMHTYTNGPERGVTLGWRNSEASVRQTFVMVPGDERLYLRLEVTPREGRRIDSLVLRLKCAVRMGNTAYGHPATRSAYITTRDGEALPPRRVDLTPTRQFWVVYANRDLGTGPAALMFRPEEVLGAHVLLAREEIHTVLRIDPGRRVFHLALWDVPKLPNGQLSAWLRAADSDVKRGLDRFAATGLSRALGVVRTAEPPLHLVPDIYAPSESEAARGFVLSPHDTLEYADANTLPTSSLNRVSMWGCAGQSEASGFCLYALRNLGDVTAEPSDLVSAGGGRIGASAVDLRVVKVWPQRESLWWGPSGEFELTPELLVRDDTLPLSEVWPVERTGRTGLIRGPAVTRIPRDTARQFVVRVEIPAAAAAGTYAGAVRIGTGSVRFELPVSVEVLPIRLAAVDERYVMGIYYRGQPQADESATNVHSSERVTLERFRGDMRVVRQIGFNSVTCYVSGREPDTNYLDRAFPVYRELGFRSPVTLLGWGYAYNTKYDDETTRRHRAAVAGYLRYCADRGYPEPSFYGIDEPDEKEIETVRRRSEITRSVEYGGMRGTYAVAGNTLGRLVGALNYPIVSSYFTSREDMERQCREYRAAGATPLYYWQIWGEYPKGTRLNMGFFLYASGYGGVMPYAYQHYQGDPYDAYSSGFRSVMLTYPSVDGPVLTLQALGAGAGVNDLRYWVTLDLALDALERRPGGAERAAAIRRELEPILVRYGYSGSRNWGRMIYGALRWPEHQKTVPNRQFDEDRRTLARLTMECAGRGDDSGAAGR